MKTTINTEIKGVKMEVTFEGSIKEMMAINTAMVVGTKEWLDLFQSRGNQIFDLLDAAIERVGNSEKKLYSKEKEVKHFKSIVDKNLK